MPTIKYAIKVVYSSIKMKVGIMKLTIGKCLVRAICTRRGPSVRMEFAKIRKAEQK